MIKRNAIRSYAIMSYVYTTLALLICMACWEGSRTNAAVVDSGIPQESIRLRILANSDAPQDQWIKRQIRDAVVERMNTWVQEPKGIEAARETVRGHLDEIHEVVGEVMNRHGFHDAYQVEFGMVPFPTKMYGNQVYPAGDYEALLVTIGRGEGQNWWCVLFPPLCFVDVTVGEAVAKPAEGQALTAQAEKKDTAAAGQTRPGSNVDQAKDDSDAKSRDGSKAEGGKTNGDVSWKETKPEVRFFVWDILQRVGGWVKVRLLA